MAQEVQTPQGWPEVCPALVWLRTFFNNDGTLCQPSQAAR